MNTFIEQILSELKGKNPLYIKIRVSCPMPTTQITAQMEDGTYKMTVHAPPMEGKANEVLCKFLKKALKLKDIAIVSGGRDKLKLMRLSG